MKRASLPLAALALLIFALVAGSVRADPTGVGTLIEVPWREGDPPVIDAAFDDWPPAPVVHLNAEVAALVLGPTPYPDLSDASMKLQAAWDETHLYLAMRVLDDALINDSGDKVWQDDEIELGFDGNHDFDGDDPSDHQFTFNPDGRITDFAAPTSLVQAAFKTSIAGWMVEAAIPLSAFGMPPPGNDSILGFNFVLRDDDDGGTYEHKLVWQGDSTSEHWEQFGQMKLVNGPAQGVLLLRQGLNGYAGASDAWITAFQPDANFGAASQLEMRAAEQSAALLRFDLSPLPANAVVQKAELRLVTIDRTNDNSANMAVYALRRAWDSASVTWNQASAGEPWASAGAADPDQDRFPDPVDTVVMDSLEATYRWDITEQVQRWHESPDTNFGVLLAGLQGPKVAYTVHSSESSELDKRPLLAIEYVYIPATPTATATPSPTFTPTPNLTPPTSTPTPTATLTPTPTFTPTSTPTLTPTPTATPGGLAIHLAQDAECGRVYRGDTEAWPAWVSSYPSCRPDWPETGPEAIYRLQFSRSVASFFAQLFYDASAIDLDLFLLTDAAPESCLMGVDSVMQLEGLASGEYFLVADGYQGDSGPFTLQIDCTLAPAPIYMPLLRK
ncbi:MAG: DNRLRE domain-containing protein [Chloroflexi bacterium]|nr:DNRLRE domain-containing protein [Chloroflexota bacterium]